MDEIVAFGILVCIVIGNEVVELRAFLIPLIITLLVLLFSISF